MWTIQHGYFCVFTLNKENCLTKQSNSLLSKTHNNLDDIGTILFLIAMIMIRASEMDGIIIHF